MPMLLLRFPAQFLVPYAGSIALSLHIHCSLSPQWLLQSTTQNCRSNTLGGINLPLAVPYTRIMARRVSSMGGIGGKTGGLQVGFRTRSLQVSARPPCNACDHRLENRLMVVLRACNHITPALVVHDCRELERQLAAELTRRTQ